jgi:uncharacterized membrane protein (DUF4010 family)
MVYALIFVPTLGAIIAKPFKEPPRHEDGLYMWVVDKAIRHPVIVLCLAAGALVAALVAVAYWKSRGRSAVEPEADPGLTTELALFITYLVGVLAVQQPVLGAAAAAVVAGLLAARERLHRFATEILTQAELHDALLLAALALVLLPLVPAAPWPGLGGMAARTLLLTTLLILSLQGAGHVALRLLGPHAGLALSGLLSGFVSSTATIASLGAQARSDPDWLAACQAGAMFSTTATWLQVLMLVGALAPAALPSLLPVAGAGAVVALGTALLQWRSAAPAPAEPRRGALAPSGPLRLREALIVTALLAAVSVGVSWALRQFGGAGLLIGTGLAALADAHSPVATLATLQAAGQVDSRLLVHGTLIAVAANALTRSGTAALAGGGAYGRRVALSLLLSTGSAGLASLLWPPG